MLQFSHDMVMSARNRYRKKVRSSHHKNNLSVEFGYIKPVEKQKNIINFTNSFSEKKKNKLQQAQNMVEKYFDKINETSNVLMKSKTKLRSNKIMSNSNSRYSKTQSIQIDKIQKIFPWHVKKQKQEHLASCLNELNKDHQLQDTTKKFMQITHQHNKYGISQTSIQSWLNEALAEASSHLIADSKQQNAALVAYNIDRSSLLAKGINPNNINRLYRSIFVYSLGFNNLLKELCNKNNELKQSIWRAFALLLEYCSQGQFQTVMGQLERDKQNKIIQMRTEIQNRQKIIDSNDQISENKTAKIVKQIRQFQQKNSDLQSERQVILQQFHETQQAFNEQIQLRLKYETKINQIHGAYEQLHQRFKLIKQQNKKMSKQLQKQKQTNENLNKTSFQLRISSQQYKQQIIKLQLQRAQIYEALAKIEKEHKMQIQHHNQFKNANTLLNSSILQKNRVYQQMHKFLSNSQSTQTSLLKTIHSKNQQFQKVIKQNKQLQANACKNALVINQLLQQKRQICQQSSKIQALAAMEAKKVSSMQNQLKQLKQQLQLNKNEIEQKVLQLNGQTLKIQSLQDDLKIHNININKMKQKQNQLSYLLQAANNKIDALQEISENKKKQEQRFIILLQSQKSKNQQLRTQIVQKNAKIQILQDQLKAQLTVWQTKLEKMAQSHDRFKQKCLGYEKQRDSWLSQLDDSKEKYEKVFMMYKNQKFERNNLDMYYKQSLTVMEEQIEHIKKLNIQISYMNETISEGKRKYQSLQTIHKCKIQMLSSDISFWKGKFQQTTIQLKQRKCYIHPHLFQDVSANFHKLRQKCCNLQQNIKKKDFKIQQLQKQKIRICKQSQKSLTTKNESLQTLYESQIAKKDLQIQFLKQKVAYQTQKLIQLDQSLSKTQKQKIFGSQTVSKIEMQYMSKILEKDKFIQEINQKYRACLIISEQQLQANAKSQDSLQKQRKQSQQKIDFLVSQIKILESKIAHGNVTSSHKIKQDKNHRPQNQVENIKTKKTQQSYIEREADNDPNEDQRTGWISRQQQQENIQIGFQNNQYQNKQTQKSKQIQNFKKRQGFRKKIKGAYMYYHQ